MDVLVTALHVAVCLCLIAIVLLQHGKGADIGVSFGGGSSNTVFGARGAGNFLTKLTTGAAVVFMVTSFALSRFGGRGDVEDILSPTSPTSAPAPPESSFPEAEALESGEPSEIEGFEVIDPPSADPETP